MHSANCTKEVHLQNKSTDDESCDELKLQGENLEARCEKAPGKLQAYVIPASPFRAGRTGDGLLRSAPNAVSLDIAHVFMALFRISQRDVNYIILPFVWGNQCRWICPGIPG